MSRGRWRPPGKGNLRTEMAREADGWVSGAVALAEGQTLRRPGAEPSRTVAAPRPPSVPMPLPPYGSQCQGQLLEDN